MSKAIVFCADGTWNGPDGKEQTTDRTNVYRVFSNLAGLPEADPALDEQERNLVNAGGKIVQVAKYLHGVGNSNNPIIKILGGAVGTGTIARIVRGYTFISRNYLAGDRIYILGFSRGAYTARALAGLISTMGLLDATSVDLADKIHAYRLGLTVWYHYRKQINRGTGILGDLKACLDSLALTCLDDAASNLLPHVPLEAVTVWDTVGSLGIPLYARGGVLDYFQFADLRLPPAVRTGIHAVATDEQRMTFTPTLWDPDPRVTQVLFPGAHCDVGGGYADTDLSAITYLWLASKLALLGVLFADKPSYTPKPDAGGIGHEPWKEPQWVPLGAGPRSFPANIIISRATQTRMGLAKVSYETSEAAPYKPTNPKRFSEGYDFLPDEIDPWDWGTGKDNDGEEA